MKAFPNIIAFDPGGTTGVFEYHWEDGNLDVVEHSQILPGRSHYSDIYDLVNQGPSFVVCESFQYRQNDKTNIVLDSVKYIGFLEYLCNDKFNIQLFMQTAAQAKGLITDDILKKLGWYKIGMRHANDAARHCAYFMIQQKKYNWKALLEKAFK